MAEREFREGDTLTLKVRVVRVSDDGELVTVDCWGQRITNKASMMTFEKHEKGGAWPKK